VSIGTGTIGSPIGSRFIGLSLEAAALPNVARDSTRGNLVGLLRSIGPGVLRFGGISAELSTTFSPGRAGRHPPASKALSTVDFLRPTRITPADFDRLRALLRRVGWTALLSVPLGRYDPAAAAREAGAASRRLGRSLAAIEIGNEPNEYGVLGLRPLPPFWSYQQYLPEFQSYERAIAAVAPRVAIAGPDTALDLDNLAWLTAFAHDVRPTILTPHFYALTACNQTTPTLEDLLSPSIAASQDQTLGTWGTVGRATRLQVRLGETNNVACTGQAGVSDTYGSALWAVRLMLAAARAGIGGVNFHTLLGSCYGRYSPICSPTPTDFAAGRLRAMPEWYALLLVRRLVGEQLLAHSVSGDHPGLTVDPLASPSRRQIDVVIVNASKAPAPSYSIRLRIPSRFRSSAVLWLSGPTLGATSGVTLGGAAVGPDGSWHPTRPLPPGALVGREFRLTVPPASAALVRLRAGTPSVATN
jgi:hypothetical protein